jgi:thiol-disulfide isomerase/thioredoxin
LDRPHPEDFEPYGGPENWRKQIQLMRIMVGRAILATNPPFELEKKAWHCLWFPYLVLSKEVNRDEWLPKMKATYDELTELSRKKGEVLDEQTAMYFTYRAVFLHYITELDHDFLSHADKLLGEIGNAMKKHREFDRLAEQLYEAKNRIFSAMSEVGVINEKYRKLWSEFSAEQTELVWQNEDRLQTTSWYRLMQPSRPYDTPEKQAEVYRWIEKYQKLIDTNEETKRFETRDVNVIVFYQGELFTSLIQTDETLIPKFLTFLEALERKIDPNDQQLNYYFSSGYRNIAENKVRTFTKNGGSDDDLAMIFYAMEKFLDIDNSYYAAHWIRAFVLIHEPTPFEQCTPQQQEFFMNRLNQLVAKMEARENTWKDARKRMSDEGDVERLRKYVDFLRLSGTVVPIAGKMVDGEPFDIVQYRGKVVVLHLWATSCAPCLRQIPMLQELHTKYHDQGFEVLGICYDGKPEPVREFLEKRKLPWISLFDKDLEIFNRFSHGNSSIDCLLDREGKAVFYRSDEELKGILEKMFAR